MVKAYVEERGSPLVHAAIARNKGGLYLTPAVALEVLTTLARRFRANQLTRSEYRAARTTFLQALGRSFDLVEVRRAEFSAGYDLADQYRQISVGAMDVLHVASALHLQAASRSRPLIV